jgi:hypothetical protein
MHPEILRRIAAQRDREMRARAHQATLGRSVRKTLRDMRRGAGAPVEDVVMSAIPDYVDGTFRTASADEPGQPGRVPVSRSTA